MIGYRNTKYYKKENILKRNRCQVQVWHENRNEKSPDFFVLILSYFCTTFCVSFPHAFLMLAIVSEVH